MDGRKPERGRRREKRESPEQEPSSECWRPRSPRGEGRETAARDIRRPYNERLPARARDLATGGTRHKESGGSPDYPRAIEGGVPHPETGNRSRFGLPAAKGNNGGFCAVFVQNPRRIPRSRAVDGGERY